MKRCSAPEEGTLSSKIQGGAAGKSENLNPVLESNF